MMSLMLATVALPGVAVRAADNGVSLERFRPALDANGILDVESATVQRHLDGNVSMWMGWEQNALSLRVDGQRAGAIVGTRLHGNLTGALGLLDWLQIGIDQPLVLWTTHDAIDGLTVGTATGLVTGDLRLVPKAQLLRHNEHLIDLAVQAAVGVPTNIGGVDWVSDGALSLTPEVAAMWPVGPARLLVNVGYRLRPEKQVLDLVVGPEVMTRAALAVDVGIVSLQGSISQAFSPSSPPWVAGGLNESPTEALAGASIRLGMFDILAYGGVGLVAGYGTPDMRAGATVRLVVEQPRDRDGDGVNDDADACPDIAEDRDGRQDDDGCPDLDDDGDGVLEPHDGCPDEAEDLDGRNDDDGCPDVDEDADGVADDTDQCPEQAEDPDGFEDSDGCPEQQAEAPRLVPRTVVGERIVFEKSRAAIDPRSLPLLDRLANELKSRTGLTRVRIEGHTDSDGTDEVNLTLSRARANAVRSALIARGVPAALLEVEAFGESHPVANNETGIGREQNRRVEILLFENAAAPKPAPSGEPSPPPPDAGTPPPVPVTP
jgi:outer membrane protein OmpA-like peptidoglycan-associated protein